MAMLAPQEQLQTFCLGTTLSKTPAILEVLTKEPGRICGGSFDVIDPFELGQTLCGIATRRNLCRRGWSPDARFRVFVHEHLESVAHDHSRW